MAAKKGGNYKSVALNKSKIEKFGGIDAMCECLANGDSIRDIAKVSGVNIHAVNRFLLKEEHEDAYRAANKIRAQGLVDEIAGIVDDPTLGDYTDKDGNLRVDTGAVNRAKLRVENRRWLAGRLDPDAFGDENKVPNVTINLNDVHLESIKRRNGDDAKVIDG